VNASRAGEAWATAFRRAVATLPRLPGALPSPPVAYSPALVGYVWSLLVGAVAAAVFTVRPQAGQWPLLLLGGVATAALAGTAVRELSGQSSHWSVSTFATLALSLSAGPAGALVGAVGEGTGAALRLRTGWFRASFNITDTFLGNLAAWAVFHALAGPAPGLAVGLLSGLAAGAAQYTVNIGLLAGVQRILDADLDVPAYVGRNAASVLPYHLGAGCTAFGTAVLVAREGPGGFVLLLVPVGLLQGFLLVLAARTRAAEGQREAHLRERQMLMQRALDAAEAERRRIVRDLHDGVVQDLAAMALGLRSRGEAGRSLEPDAALEVAAATGEAIEELRTLLRQIALPDLQERGLSRALEELAEPLRERGVEVLVEVEGPAAGVEGPALETAFRVVQEALRNVADHARAARVRMHASYRGGWLTLEIADDGVGFSDEERRRSAAHGHLGLSLVEQLVGEVGGELAIASAPRRGTTLQLRLPVAET
jgi:signal transduction histidine kinase